MTIKQLIPGFVKTMLKSVIPISIIDQLEVITGERDYLTPPKRLHFVGGGDFKEHGSAFMKRFKELGQLKPTDHVLDIGSGVGRMAVPLSNYLSSTGRYEGVEIVLDGVDWCNQHIAKTHPNFHFSHLNVYNKMYNPKGTLLSSEVSFPFPAQTFDFIFLTSVFTHMLQDDVAHYLAELHRMLKPDGRVYFTIFLLNPTAHWLIAANQSSIAFKPFTDLSMVENRDTPENAIAFDESLIMDILARTGFIVEGSVHYGHWSGRDDAYDYQDTVVVTKRKES